MANYIVSEIKQALARKYTKVYFLAVIALVLIANIAVIAFRSIYGANEGTYAYNLIEYATWCFIIPYYSCIFIADIVFGEQYPNPHIKDAHTSGLGRTKIFLSKFIASLFVGLVFSIVAIVALIVITNLFQIKDGLISWYSISDFFSKMFIAIPLWIAGIAFGIMFLFAFTKKKIAYISFYILTFGLPRVIMIFAAEPFKIGFFRVLRTYTITQNMTLIPYPADPSRNVTLTIILGILYTIIALCIGGITYNKKKI